MLREYAREHGLNVIDEYIDDGWSGTNFDRPNFQRMIDDIEDGKINCVVTKDLSRLGRNYILTGQYTEIYFPSKGVRYIAINDNVDTINGENELAPFLNILNERCALTYPLRSALSLCKQLSLFSASICSFLLSGSYLRLLLIQSFTSRLL